MSAESYFLSDLKKEFVILFRPLLLGDIDRHATDHRSLAIGGWDRELTADGMTQNAIFISHRLDRLASGLVLERQLVVFDKRGGRLRWKDLFIGLTGKIFHRSLKGGLSGRISKNIPALAVLDP